MIDLDLDHDHYEGVMYADDIPEGTDYLPGTTDPIPDDYERHYCEEDGEDWPCATVRLIDAALDALMLDHEVPTGVRPNLIGGEVLVIRERTDAEPIVRAVLRAALAHASEGRES